MRKICLVSEECNGVARGGGIGACVRGLAQLWASAGHEVHLLITDMTSGRDKVDADASSFVTQIFFLSDIAEEDAMVFAPVDAPSKAYCVYRFLHERDYSEVHFNDWLGCGFYVAMARRQGSFGATVVTHLHGSSEWVRGYNLHPPELDNLETEALERSQIENSDIVISPSRYLLGWCAQHELQLPRPTQRQWVLPQWLEPSFVLDDAPLRTRAVPPDSVKQIIYFGRHERRKGFELFVDAIARLPDDVQPDITFVGRFDRIGGEFTGSLALRKLREHAGRLRFFNDLDQKGATSLLRRAANAICVMPSLIENSPCVVGECFTFGIPFLAADVGGTAELIAEGSRDVCLFQPTPAALAAAIVKVVKTGMPPVASTLTPRSLVLAWKDPIVVENQADRDVDAHPLVSVCFTHYERPLLLRRAYEATLAQTYDNIEIIIVDDGSRTEGAHAYLDEIEASAQRFPVTIVRSENKYLGAARNAGARQAQGEFLLFHDDDNFAEPHEVESFVKAALHSGADVLTSQCYVFRDGEWDKNGVKRKIEFYPLGIGGVFSFFKNRFGDANALVRRSTFEALGGFTEERGIGWEDWEFFLKAYMKDCRMGIVPKPLFNYRVSGAGMLQTGNPMLNYERIYKAIDEAKPRVNADLVRYANREGLGGQIFGRTLQAIGREKGFELHEKLTTLEPNSPEAIDALSDLAFELGRFAEAIELGARNFDQRERIADLLKAMPSLDGSGHRMIEITVVNPDERREGVLLEGWMVDGYGAPYAIDRVLVNGEWFSVVGIQRFDRKDVAKALRLPSAKKVGFHLFALAPSRARERNPLRRGLASARLTIGHGAKRMGSVTSFAFDNMVVKLPNISGGRGHVDRGSWQRRVPLKLPTDRHDSPHLEIETAIAAQTAILWGDGVIDTGIRASECRSKFTREELGTPAQGTVSAIVPDNVRSHVLLI